MALIDDKGRIFGKLNILDLFVLICLIGMVPVFIFGYKVYKSRPIPMTIEAQLREQVKELSDKLAKEVQWRQKVVEEHPRLKKY